MNKTLLFPYTPLHREFNDTPFIVESGREIYVYDEYGNEYIDGVSSLYNVLLGYSDARLIAAASKQLDKLPFYGSFNNQTHVEAIKLANTLASLSPIKNATVFFANSGSEANDTAIKVVWCYNNALGRKNKKIILAFSGCYHGATIGSGSLSGIESLHKGFDLPLETIKHLPLPTSVCSTHRCDEEVVSTAIDAVEREILSIGAVNIAGFIVEPVFTAPGVLIPSDDYLKKLSSLLKKYDILLIADEVVTSFLRCGAVFYCDRVGITPDIITVSKGLASSYVPISAVILSEKIVEALQIQSDKEGSFFHGFTCSGHPLATAVANKAIEIYTDCSFFENTVEISQYFSDQLNQLASHPVIRQVRSVGMLGAIDIVENTISDKQQNTVNRAEEIVKHAKTQKLLLRSCFNTIIIAPPLITSTFQLDVIFTRLKAALESCKTRS